MSLFRSALLFSGVLVALSAQAKVHQRLGDAAPKSRPAVMGGTAKAGSNRLTPRKLSKADTADLAKAFREEAQTINPIKLALPTTSNPDPNLSSGVARTAASCPMLSQSGITAKTAGTQTAAIADGVLSGGREDSSGGSSQRGSL